MHKEVIIQILICESGHECQWKTMDNILVGSERKGFDIPLFIMLSDRICLVLIHKLFKCTR